MKVTIEKRRKLEYAREKYSCAVNSLATGPGDVRSRLYAAFRHFHAVSMDDLPSDLAKQHKKIISRLTLYKPRNYIEKKFEGSLGVSIRRMKNSTGVNLANLILTIKYKLDTLLENDDI